MLRYRSRCHVLHHITYVWHICLIEMAYSFQEQQRDNYRISLWVEFSRSGARCRWAVSSNPGLLAGHNLSNPHRPMDTSAARPPHLSAVDTPRDKFLWNVLSRPDLRDGNWAWTAIEADCGGFPDCRNSCGAACGLPPIGAILTSDGANPGLQGAGSVSGSRSPYTFMYCPYYPTITSAFAALKGVPWRDTQSAQSELSDDTHVEERGKEGNVATLSSNGLKNIYCQPILYQLGFYNFPEVQLVYFFGKLCHLYQGRLHFLFLKGPTSSAQNSHKKSVTALTGLSWCRKSAMPLPLPVSFNGNTILSDLHRYAS